MKVEPYSQLSADIEGTSIKEQPGPKVVFKGIIVAGQIKGVNFESCITKVCLKGEAGTDGQTA